jgi:hypothetical protein
MAIISNNVDASEKNSAAYTVSVGDFKIGLSIEKKKGKSKNPETDQILSKFNELLKKDKTSRFEMFPSIYEEKHLVNAINAIKSHKKKHGIASDFNGLNPRYIINPETTQNGVTKKLFGKTVIILN